MGCVRGLERVGGAGGWGRVGGAQSLGGCEGVCVRVVWGQSMTPISKDATYPCVVCFDESTKR